MSANKICKVCGKEYVPCRSIRPADNTFNWRTVACSPKCGEEYFRQVAVARGLVTEDEKPSEAYNMTDASVDIAFDEDAEIETFFDD